MQAGADGHRERAMTIHTKWMELLRSEATDAFEYGAFSTRVEAGFIDGQIKLMKSEATQTWCSAHLSARRM
jgi:hypothetical protein